MWAVSHSTNTNREQNIQLWNTEIKKRFPNAKNASLPTVFLDIKDGEEEDLRISMKELQNIVSRLPMFDCKDIKAVQAENDRLKSDLEKEKSEHNTVRDHLKEKERELANAKRDLEKEKKRNQEKSLEQKEKSLEQKEKRLEQKEEQLNSWAKAFQNKGHWNDDVASPRKERGRHDSTYILTTTDQRRERDFGTAEEIQIRLPEGKGHIQVGSGDKLETTNIAADFDAPESEEREKVKEICQVLSPSNDKMKQLEEKLEDCIRAGLETPSGSKNSVKCLPTYVRHLPNGEERGQYLSRTPGIVKCNNPLKLNPFGLV